MKLLIVEDEQTLREQLVQALHAQGYSIEEASDGKEAVYAGLEYAVDLAIVDVGLPELDGIEVIRRWREAKRTFPILLLTARGNWQDKVAGLEAGADDYMVKPFHLAELQARIKALLRRAAGHAASQLKFGPITIDLTAKQVSLHQQTLELTAFEYNTLEYLCHKPGQVVSKSELTDHLYEQDFDRDSNVIEVFVGRLRKKLDPDGSLKPIKTLRGQGYLFCLQKDA